MPISRPKLIVAIVLAALLGVGIYLTATIGMRELRTSAVDTTPAGGSVPEFIYNAPDTVPTTAEYGPVGPVSAVFAGTDVITGLSGELENPWIAISSQTGDYRALSAPHRPEPDPAAVSVSADGTALAWGAGSGVVVYDPVEDETRELTEGVGADPIVGPFSPDGRHLVAFDGSLQVLDVESGEVVATLSGVGEKSARQAVWTPDGAALTYVADGRLVTRAWQAGTRTEAPTSIAPGATLAWQPAGNQIAAMRDIRGVKVVDVFDVAADGGLSLARTVHPDGYALQQLLGFTSDTRLTVSALTLETGAIARVYRMSTVDTSPPAQVMQLAAQGTNWASPQTLQMAGEPLASGSAAFEEPSWPWSDVSKLVASVIAAVFALGLYLTRRLPKRMRKA